MKRQRKFALPPSSLVESDKPKSRSRKNVESIEIGDTGTVILKGIIRDEYNPKLAGREAMLVYDEMRKSDATVCAAVQACSLPIRRAKWIVQAASEDAIDIEIAEFVEDCLFEYQTISWEDILRQALLHLDFGVMVFEKVYTIRNVDGIDRIVWEKLAPRLPRSIFRWETGDGSPGIQQYLTTGKVVDIPMEKLIVFVNRMEGSNWWGISALRAAYKHWYIKNNLYKIDAIAAERQGLGVPYAKMPAQYTEDDRAKAETILQNLRAHDMAFIIEPNDYEIGFKDMKASSTRDISPTINHHNREISKSVLAHFLDLGSTDSGSRALSQDQTDLFLLANESVGKYIGDIFTQYAIKELVDLNFNNVKEYPKLMCTGMSRTDVTALSNAIATLVGVDALRISDQDESYLRDITGLPPRDPEEPSRSDKTEMDTLDDNTDTKVTAKNKQSAEDTLDEMGMSEFDKQAKKKIYPERSAVREKIEASIKDMEHASAVATIKRNLALIECSIPLTYHHRLFSMIKSELNAKLSSLRRFDFAETNTFKSYRPLTFAEQKVNFDSLQSKLDQLEEGFDALTQELLHEARDKFIADMSVALKNGDQDAIRSATMKFQNDYAKLIKVSMRDAFEYGKNNAAKEIGVSAKGNPVEILRQINIQSDAIADLHVSQITNAAKTSLVDALNKGASNAVALAAADTVASDLIDALTGNTSDIIMSGYVNYGRSTVFEDNIENIYALQRSEILDEVTCNYCLSVDGRVVEKDDPFAKNTIFHSNCRGIWVAIMLDEQELPKIGGMPQSVRDRFGDAVNDLLQPKTPITKKNTDARKEAERRARRKAQ